MSVVPPFIGLGRCPHTKRDLDLAGMLSISDWMPFLPSDRWHERGFETVQSDLTLQVGDADRTAFEKNTEDT